MPKERSHLLFASEVLDRLDNEPLQQLIRRRAPAYYLGTIVPDLKNYDLFSFGEFAHVSDFIHELVETDETGLIFPMLEKIRQGAWLDEERTAFVMGYITHAVSDAVFHPLIFYFSGNIYDPDLRQRNKSIASHMFLETSLELALFRSAGKELKDFPPTRLCRSGPPRRRRLFSFFARLLAERCGEDQDRLYRAMEKSYNQFLRVTRWFPRPFSYFLARLVDLVTLGRFRHYLGLFHAPADPLSPLFSGPIEYINPFTGEKVTTSIKDLNEQVVTVGVTGLNAAHAFLLGKAPLQQLRALLWEKSMNTGTSQPARAMKHRSTERF